jgi:hypothetical protein
MNHKTTKDGGQNKKGGGIGCRADKTEENSQNTVHE